MTDKKKNFYQITSPKDGRVLYESSGVKAHDVVYSGDGKRVLSERKNED